MSPRETSMQTIATEWTEARQMLNDARMSDFTLPEAVEVLLGYRQQITRRDLTGVVDLALERSKRIHPSSRRRADLSVAPEVIP